MVIAGASAYSRVIDWKRFRAIADAVGAKLHGRHGALRGARRRGASIRARSGIADYVTTTTHKTLRGPRGGLISVVEEHEKAINSAVFPGLQGGPLMHVIAAKAVALRRGAQARLQGLPAASVIENARVLATVLHERGLRIVSGGTDSHLFLVDLRAKKITGKDAETALARRAHHGQQERDPERSREAVRDVGHPHRQPGDHDARLHRARTARSSAT